MAEATAVLRSSEDVVLTFIRENFGLSVTRDEFNKIDSSLFCPILAKFLEDFGIDNYFQLDLLAVQGVSNIEKYEETTQVINLWQAVSHLLVPLGMNDFALGDVLNPRKAKAMKVILHLIRLWEKYSCVHSEWIKIEEQFAEIPERKRLIESDNRELQRQLEEKSCLLARLRTENGKQEQMLASYAEEQQKLIAKGEELSESFKALKLQMATKKEELSEMILKINQIKQDIEEVQAKVVRSPEKIVAEIENKEKLLENLRVEKSTLDKEYTVVSDHLQNLETAMKQSSVTMEVLTQTVLDMENFKEEIRKIDNIKTELKAKEHTFAELNAIFQENETNIQEIQKQKGVANVQQTQRLRPTKDMNDDLKAKLNKLLETESKLESEYEENKIKILKQFKEAEGEHENFMLQIKTNEEKLFGKVGDYSKLLNRIKEGVCRKYQ